MNRKTLALIACCLIAPAAAIAQTGGLTKVQLYALQQELKNECGLQHSTGVMDGPTRHAIAVCNKKYGTEGNGAALLAAMNIGFSAGDNPPQGMGSVMGNSDNTKTTGATAHSRRRARGAMRDSTEEASESPTAERAENKGEMKDKTKTTKTPKTAKITKTKAATTPPPAKKY